MAGVAAFAVFYFFAVVYFTARQLQQQAPDLPVFSAMCFSLAHWTMRGTRLAMNIAVSFVTSVVPA